MNWKKRYEPIKVGDTVKLVEYNDDCGNGISCCNNNGFYIGKIYKVERIDKEEIGIKNVNGWCSFPKECLEKI